MTEPIVRLPQRPPSRFILASYLEASPAILGLLAGGLFFGLRAHEWPGTAVWFLIGPLLALRVLLPIHQRCFTAFEVSDRGLVLSTGMMFRRIRSAEWSALPVLEVHESWAFRTLGLARVTLSQSADEASRLVLPAVDAATRSSLERHLDAARRQAMSSSSATTSPAGDGKSNEGHRNVHVLYKSTFVDLLVSSLVHGQFVVVGGAIVIALVDLIGTIGLTDSVFAALMSSPTVLAVVCATVFLAAGFALAALRFYGFEARKEANGVISVRYGLVNRQERVIHAQAIVGVELRRNLVEIALGRVRLSLLTIDSRSQLGVNLLLPSLPRHVVSRIIDVGLADSAPVSPLNELGRRALARSIVCVVIVGAITALAAFTITSMSMPPLWITLSASIGVFLVVSALGRLLTASLVVEIRRQLVTRESFFMTDRQTTVSAGRIHSVTLMGTNRRVLAGRLSYYAGGARTMIGLRLTGDPIDGLLPLLSSLGRVTGPRQARSSGVVQ